MLLARGAGRRLPRVLLVAVLLVAATLIAVAALSAVGLLVRREVEVVRPRLMLDRYNAFGGYRGLCGFEKRGFFYVAERG
ncbi:MAG: hypothetical protein LM590_09930, partial [Thermofilum sp.]|nr:hypothetical protein [Thermofilum sp.]